MHCVAIYTSTRELIKHMGRKETYISDEQLLAMEPCIYHGIHVHVEWLDGGRISQMSRCTGSRSWHGRDRRNNWVWVTQCLGRCHGALNGRLPWQLQQLFKINLLNEDRAFVEYWLALALTTIPENSCNLDPVSTFAAVGNASAAVALQVFSVGHIVGCAHRFPETATSIKPGDRRNEQVIVNSHMDLVTWNDLYNP